MGAEVPLLLNIGIVRAVPNLWPWALRPHPIRPGVYPRAAVNLPFQLFHHHIPQAPDPAKAKPSCAPRYLICQPRSTFAVGIRSGRVRHLAESRRLLIGLVGPAGSGEVVLEEGVAELVDSPGLAKHPQLVGVV